MYQNPRNRPRPSSRPIYSDRPLEGRRLWEIGSWGNASDHIGQRWEELGRQALEARVLADQSLWLGQTPPTPVTFVGDETVQAGFQSLGLTNPDAIVVDRVEDSLLVRPVDFKWSLETASYRQISGSAFTALLTHPDSPLPAALRHLVGLDSPANEAATPGEPFAAESPANGTPALTPTDGFFFAPDSRPNRQFIGSPANQRQEYPIEPKDVVLETVDGKDFFGLLPWWPQALRLAEIDRMTRSLGDLDGAERYYRLGAGAGGALVKLDTSIFATEPATIDVAAKIEASLRTSRSRTSLELLEYLRQHLDQREIRVQRAREITRCPYSFRDLLADLAIRGVQVAEDDPSRVERDRWGKVHKAIAAAHRSAVNAAGRELVAQGQTEVAALTELESRRVELDRRARAIGQRLLREALTEG